MEEIEQLLSNVKEQVQIYLLDSGEFFPFGVAIDITNNIKPFSIYINEKNDRPSSLDLINLLENHVQKELINGNYLFACICINVALKQNEQLVDAIEIRIFEKNNTYKKYFEYIIKANYVEFIN